MTSKATKTCNLCGKSLGVEMFTEGRRVCKLCRAERERARYAEGMTAREREAMAEAEARQSPGLRRFILAWREREGVE